MDIDSSKKMLVEAIANWLPETCSEDLTETDTRCKVVDFVLVRVLGWPEASIRREPFIKETGRLIDYLLSTTRPAYVIEAKRAGVAFRLPQGKGRRRFKIGGVMSEDRTLLASMLQAQAYAVSKGVSYCAVTNGKQWVFYRSSNNEGLEFSEQQAIVFRSLDEVRDSFGEFWDCLAFQSVSEGAHHLVVRTSDNAEGDLIRFKRLSDSTPTGSFRNRNRLFPFIREVVTEVFQDLASDNASEDLIEQCYVTSVRDSSYDQSLRALLKDRPTFSELQVEPLVVKKRDAGGFERVFDRGGVDEVVLLLGGIGAGKSTFIHRFRKVIARERIERECIWANINFNKYSDSPGYLTGWVAEKITSEIEREYPSLEFGSYNMLKQAYHSEYERLKRGRLAPLFAESPAAFETEFGKVLVDFESDRIGHLIKLLKAAASKSKRRVFLVFDNADQFDASLQNDVFMLARRVAQEASCSLIISLREESYWKNKDYGALSAFHSVNFHVEAPRIRQVISKRFKYAQELLRESMDNYVVPSSGMGVKSDEGLSVFDAIKTSILGEDSSIVDFLEHVSPGEVRRPLEQLARFLFSGHTNIDAVLRNQRERKPVEIGFHEFLKSVALGDREHFDEHRSDLINIFAVDGSADGSNLNRLSAIGRVLNARSDHTEVGVGFLRLEALVSDLLKHGIQEETTLSIVDFLNARRLFETETQTRQTASGATFVRATAAADYYITDLAFRFAYVDLVVPGTLVSADASFDIIERISQQIYSLGGSAKARFDKLVLRLSRAIEFASYIRDQAHTNAIFQSEGFIDPRVSTLVRELPDRLNREKDVVLGSARDAFGIGRS